MSSEDIQKLVHELDTYQVELEIQNEDLRQVQEELNTSRKRFSDLYDFAPVGYLTISDKGLIVECNLTAAEMLGGERGFLLNQPLSAFIAKEDQDILYNHRAKLLHSEGQQSFDLRMKNKQGAFFYAHVEGTVLADVDGDAGQFRMCIGDVTERKQAEEALTISEQKNKDAYKFLELIVDTIPVRLFWKDKKLNYLGCNRLFAQDAGCRDPEELVGANDYDMGWTVNADQYRKDDLEVIKSGKSKLNYEEPQTTPEGKQIWLSASKVPLRDAKDNIIGLLGVYEDVTQRKLEETELLKVQKLESLGRLAGGIAHNFNNILMSIMGNVSLAKMTVSPTDSIYERLTNAEEACFRAKDLAQQFLTFSKGGDPVMTTILVADLVKSSCQLALSGTTSSWECSIPEDLWNFYADANQIGQALTNILINADQAMPNGGKIKVCCQNVVSSETDNLPLKNGKYVKTSIRDQGIGIREEYLDSIFDPYFTTKATGNGLGLSSAYSILKKHEGCLIVESTSESGTVFSFYIPASTSDVELAEDAESQLLKSSGKILVMDDDKMVRDMIGVMLEHLGYHAAFAEDGEKALAKYVKAMQTNKPFDLVIMDLIIPDGMGGAEAIKKLLHIDPFARVIVSSGYSNDPVLSNYSKYGFVGVLAKPYHLNKLNVLLENIFNASNH
ncbi:PAS domain-containing hybrid sensor histidine kinase/response regulator [Desulfogranum marinum]|uniref:PAS domain-containing hybrid sensor histidine kinase/response regulator n=1 Tax=Desulfogranum marinum TaxID=453220 RepID=UPI0019641602|nr:PAS domain-containing sensor histidine kinase [Desulfogranum marinum]MBM9514015.1 PAS domain S-box protein [Desulfogranum marinum]